MGRIHRLSPEVANQIAAGEVVERPASAVKELVENAIDAGATRVAVAVESGGKRRIQVVDNGEGMAPEDARLALERHATSKIQRASDLASVGTLGFRGEALPSIASVSRFRLVTRPRDMPVGTEIRIEGGALVDAGEVGAAEGTTIVVEDLFYNLPARRKFLRSDAGETTQVSRTLTQLALGHHSIGFTLTSNGRTLIECPPVTSVRDRLYQLYGDRTELVEVQRTSGTVTVSGFVAALTDHGTARGTQNLFVNRRVVRDRTIAHAVADAYSLASIRERSPEAYLFIDVPPEAVDVNAHPTKAEVRFREQSAVHQAVRRAVGDALGVRAVPVVQLDVSPIAPELHVGRLPPTSVAVLPSRWGEAYRTGASLAPSAPSLVRETPRSAPPVSDDRDLVALVPDEVYETPLVPLGQFRDTFIVAVDEAGVVFIDQHVAHERILFERISAGLASGVLESQRLLTAIRVDVSAAGHQALLDHRANLERLGFEVRDAGAGLLKVTSVPALMKLETCQATLRALADDLEGLDRGSPIQTAINEMAATMACHAAVKANDALTPEKMRYLLEELRRTTFSTVCPHGRPVLLRLPRRNLERAFERI